MIELPDWAVPNGAEPFPIPFGNWLVPSTGAEELFVARKGGRFGATFSFPPMRADRAAIVISRLTEAWHSGEILRVDYPLVGVSQGSPGSSVVDGAGQSGTALMVRGLTPGYVAKEGFWLTIYDENGRGYLENNRAPVRAAGDGTANLTISPMLRWPFADGATINLAKPTMDGRVTAQPWQIPVNRLIVIGFELREIA